MEELLEILFNLIASFFQNKAVKNVPPPANIAPPRPRVAPPPPQVTKKQQRRGARRPAPPQTVAVAQPIMTTFASASAPMQIAATSKAILSNTGITHPGEVPSQSAAAIRKWLTPLTLRNQFLLTEILQPPLALRDDRHAPR